MFAAAFLVIPAVLPAALSQSVEDATLKYTPAAAAQSLYAVTTDGGPIELLGPATGAVLAAWVALALAAGAPCWSAATPEPASGTGPWPARTSSVTSPDHDLHKIC